MPGSAPVIVGERIGSQDWDEYVSRHPDATVDHLWGWREIFEGVFRHRSVYLAATRGETLVGVLPLVLFRSRLFGKFVVSLPFLNYGGVLADDLDATRALVEHARTTAVDFGAGHVELRHQRRAMEDLPHRQHKTGLTRILPTHPDELWKDVDRKVRNQVRKAQKEGLAVEIGGVELLDEFYGVFATNMRDLGTPVFPRRLFSETMRVFADRARIYVVRHRHRAVSTAITLRFGDTVQMPWQASLRDARHLSPTMLLYWTLLEKSIVDGAAKFGFGRSTPGGGAYQFKQQWGPSETPLHWEYVMLNHAEPPDQGPSNPKFQAAIKIWQRLPMWVANGLERVVVRILPGMT